MSADGRILTEREVKSISLVTFTGEPPATQMSPEPNMFILKPDKREITSVIIEPPQRTVIVSVIVPMVDVPEGILSPKFSTTC